MSAVLVGIEYRIVSLQILNAGFVLQNNSYLFLRNLFLRRRASGPPSSAKEENHHAPGDRRHQLDLWSFSFLPLSIGAVDDGIGTPERGNLGQCGPTTATILPPLTNIQFKRDFFSHRIRIFSSIVARFTSTRSTPVSTIMLTSKTSSKQEGARLSEREAGVL